MNQGQAKAAIDTIRTGSRTLAMLDDVVARAKELIDHPDRLVQGNFGICGMTTAVRSMLQHRLDSFVELMATVFQNAPFRGIAPPPTLWRDLIGTAKSGELSMLDHTALDFLLARSLGMLFRVADPDTYAAQIEFSKRFSPRFADTSGTVIDVCTLDRACIPDLTAAVGGAGISERLAKALNSAEYWLQHQCGFGIDVAHAVFAETDKGKKWTITFNYDDAKRVLQIAAAPDDRPLNLSTQVSGLLFGEGHLAFDVPGMVTFLTTVAGFADVTQAGSWRVSESVKQVNDALAGDPKNFVYAGINAFTEFNDAHNGTTTVFDAPAGPLLSYYGRAEARPQHWIAINGPITTVGTRFHVPVWSWDGTFTIDIAKEHFDGYIERWVIGRVP